MEPAIFHLQLALKRLFINCMELYWYQFRSSWNMKGTPAQKRLPSKTAFKTTILIRVKLEQNFYEKVTSFNKLKYLKMKQRELMKIFIRAIYSNLCLYIHITWLKRSINIMSEWNTQMGSIHQKYLKRIFDDFPNNI